MCVNHDLEIYREIGFNEAARWRILNAWPRKWEGQNLNAMGNEVAMENIDIYLRRIERG
ncbi:MAG: phage tail protein [Pyrinomonadaceae bacterium]|nr:phage tail protein [Pyrinomonadaceae bacterium]